MNRRMVVVILVAVALLAIATTIRSGWLYLVSSLLLASVPVELFSAWRSTRRIEVDREAPPRVFEGEPFPVRMEVRNSSNLGSNLLEVSDLQFVSRRRGGLLRDMRRRREEFKAFMNAEDPSGDSAVPLDDTDHSRATVAIERIKRGARVDASYELTAPRRGIYEGTEVRVGSGGLFGGASVGRRIKIPTRLVVYPAIYSLGYFPFDPEVSVSPSESYEWGRKGMGQDYYGIREYVRGDSLRHVHWKNSARHGQLVVKEYQQEYKPCVGLVVLLAQPLYGTQARNSLEDGLRAAASILNYYTTMGCSPRLVFPSGNGFEVIEDSPLEEHLEVLAGYAAPHLEGRRTDETAPERLAADGLNVLAETAGHAGSFTVVTNLPPDALAAPLSRLNGNGGISLVLVIDDSYAPVAHGDGVERVRASIPASVCRTVVNLYALTMDREIGSCLNEPMNITGA